MVDLQEAARILGVAVEEAEHLETLGYIRFTVGEIGGKLYDPRDLYALLNTVGGPAWLKEAVRSWLPAVDTLGRRRICAGCGYEDPSPRSETCPSCGEDYL